MREMHAKFYILNLFDRIISKLCSTHFQITYNLTEVLVLIQAFVKKHRLPFTLLSDEGNKVRKEWGVPGDLFGALLGRQTYVLDKNGVVRLVYNNQFQPEKHIDETLKFLQSA